MLTFGTSLIKFEYIHIFIAFTLSLVPKCQLKEWFQLWNTHTHSLDWRTKDQSNHRHHIEHQWKILQGNSKFCAQICPNLWDNPWNRVESIIPAKRKRSDQGFEWPPNKQSLEFDLQLDCLACSRTESMIFRVIVLNLKSPQYSIHNIQDKIQIYTT